MNEGSESRNYGKVKRQYTPRPRIPHFDNLRMSPEQRMFYAKLRLRDYFARTTDLRVLKKVNSLPVSF
jgi:hypothetical protein